MKKFVFVITFCLVFCSVIMAYASENSGTVTYSIALNVKDGAKTAQVYLPYPMSDKNQDITGMDISGNYSSTGVYRDVKTGSTYLRQHGRKSKENPS